MFFLNHPKLMFLPPLPRVGVGCINLILNLYIIMNCNYYRVYVCKVIGCEYTNPERKVCVMYLYYMVRAESEI